MQVNNGYIGGSHHRPIIISIEEVEKQPNRFVQKRKLGASLPKCLVNEDFNELHNAICGEIQNATIDLNTVNFTPKMWWNDSLKKQHRFLCIARKREKGSNQVSDFAKYVRRRKGGKLRLKMQKENATRTGERS